VVDVFEQVEEELRADRWKSLARRFLPWVLLGLVIGLIAAAAVYGWREYQRQGAETASLAYAEGLELLQRATPRRRAQVPGGGRGPRAGYRSLALMQIGGMRLATGDVNGAATRFDEAAEASPAPVLEDSARLKAVFARMDAQPYAASIEQLTPLAADGRPYRLLALEGLALARLGAGADSGRALRHHRAQHRARRARGRPHAGASAAADDRLGRGRQPGRRRQGRRRLPPSQPTAPGAAAPTPGVQ
jgi:hypothetical protein